MRIPLSNPAKLPNRFLTHDDRLTAVNRSARRRRSQRGVAVIVMLVLLSIMLLFIAAGSHSLYRLHRDLKLTEQQQLQRLHALSMTNLAILQKRAMATNSAPANVESPRMNMTK